MRGVCGGGDVGLPVGEGGGGTGGGGDATHVFLFFFLGTGCFYLRFGMDAGRLDAGELGMRAADRW